MENKKESSKSKTKKENRSNPLFEVLKKNDYRSDLIIFLVLVSIFVTFHVGDLEDETFGNVLKWGMILVAVEYIGHETVELIAKLKK